MKMNIMIAAVAMLWAPLCSFARGHGGRGGGGSYSGMPEATFIVLMSLTGLAAVWWCICKIRYDRSPKDPLILPDWGKKNPCQNCGAVMVKLPQTYNVSRSTYRCSTYPKCHGLRYRERCKQ